jgi:hypothetical protein
LEYDVCESYNSKLEKNGTTLHNIPRLELYASAIITIIAKVKTK